MDLLSHTGLILMFDLQKMLLKEFLKMKIVMALALSLLPKILPSKSVHPMNLLQQGREFYLIPWSKIENKNPQIITFHSNGDVIKKNVPAKQFINFRKLTRSMRSEKSIYDYLRSSMEYPLESNSTMILSEIHRLINEFYVTGIRKIAKVKILTHCNEDRSTCRFVACPHVTDHCTLCEVNMKDNTINSTTCEKISTKFLTSQFNVQIKLPSTPPYI